VWPTERELSAIDALVDLIVGMTESGGFDGHEQLAIARRRNRNFVL
jgi:hypothetical protein